MSPVSNHLNNDANSRRQGFEANRNDLPVDLNCAQHHSYSSYYSDIDFTHHHPPRQNHQMLPTNVTHGSPTRRQPMQYHQHQVQPGSPAYMNRRDFSQSRDDVSSGSGRGGGNLNNFTNANNNCNTNRVALESFQMHSSASISTNLPRQLEPSPSNGTLSNHPSLNSGMKKMSDALKRFAFKVKKTISSVSGNINGDAGMTKSSTSVFQNQQPSNQQQRVNAPLHRRAATTIQRPLPSVPFVVSPVVQLTRRAPPPPPPSNVPPHVPLRPMGVVAAQRRLGSGLEGAMEMSDMGSNRLDELQQMKPILHKRRGTTGPRELPAELKLIQEKKESFESLQKIELSVRNQLTSLFTLLEMHATFPTDAVVKKEIGEKVNTLQRKMGVLQDEISLFIDIKTADVVAATARKELPVPQVVLVSAPVQHEPEKEDVSFTFGETEEFVSIPLNMNVKVRKEDDDDESACSLVEEELEEEPLAAARNSLDRIKNDLASGKALPLLPSLLAEDFSTTGSPAA